MELYRIFLIDNALTANTISFRRDRVTKKGVRALKGDSGTWIPFQYLFLFSFRAWNSTALDIFSVVFTSLQWKAFTWHCLRPTDIFLHIGAFLSTEVPCFLSTYSGNILHIWIYIIRFRGLFVFTPLGIIILNYPMIFVSRCLTPVRYPYSMHVNWNL